MAEFYRYCSAATAALVPTKTLSGGLLASVLSHAGCSGLHGIFKRQQQRHDVHQIHQRVLLNMCFYVAFDVRLQSVDVGVH